MAERHIDAIFAQAFDGRLDAPARRRFDSHIAACERCAAAFADHCAAAEALRSMPAARMPVAVRLPMHAPRAAHQAWLERLRPRSAWGLSLSSAAAVAVVVLIAVVASNRGSSSPSSGQQAVAGALSSGASSSSSSPASSGGFGAAAVPAPQLAPGGPGPFSYAVTAQRPGQPAESLVLAIASQTYSPGAQVTVSARLVNPGSSSAASAQAGNGAAPSAQAAGRPYAPQPRAADIVLLPPIAEPSVSLLAPQVEPAPAGDHAVPSSPSPIAAISSGTPGIFEVRIPPTAVHGQVLTIVATVPAGLPSSSDASAVTVSLQITVG